MTRPYAEKLTKNPNLINLGIAWVATKFTEPLRLAVTVAVTPRIARALGMASAEDDEDEDEQADKKAATGEEKVTRDLLRGDQVTFSVMEEKEMQEKKL